jgi:hypothetical protein
MKRVINTGWIILSLACSIVAIVITVSEGFVRGKAWAFFIAAAATLALWFYENRKRREKK